jgi:predicted transcriptional regulator
MPPVTDEKIKQVVAALEDERYQWRTIKGIADQTNLPREEVPEVLNKLIDTGIVVRSAVPSKSGDQLYTSRVHYTRFTPFGKRQSAAFRNDVE